jgi:PAS domain-containing protein
MDDQLSYKELLRVKVELEKKVKKLTKELKELAITGPEADALFTELFNKHNCIILLQKERIGNQPGRIVMANPAARKMLGYSEIEFRMMNNGSV